MTTDLQGLCCLSPHDFVDYPASCQPSLHPNNGRSTSLKSKQSVSIELAQGHADCVEIENPLNQDFQIVQSVRSTSRKLCSSLDGTSRIEYTISFPQKDVLRREHNAIVGKFIATSDRSW
eukprot:988083-Rhodomonas_salina.2